MNRTAVFAIALALAGCGGNSNGTPGTGNGTGGSGGGGQGSGTGGAGSGGDFTTSVPSEKRLNTLSAAEGATLCMDIGASFANPQLREGRCRFTAYVVTGLTVATETTLTDAQVQTVCSDAYDACISAGTDGGTPTSTCMQPTSMCTATVGELTACAKDLKARLVATQSATPNCNAITRASVEGMNAGGDGGVPMQTPACMTFNAGCSDDLIPEPTEDTIH